MTQAAMKQTEKTSAAPPQSVVLTKRDPASPALYASDGSTITIKAGTSFAGVSVEEDTPVIAPAGGYEPGTDYGVSLGPDGPAVTPLTEPPTPETHPATFGGFHYAPGGNAAARDGGDCVPGINPYSIWDLNFRPACPDPRGMALIDGDFWADIYLLCADHCGGTSRFGLRIADGDDTPTKEDGEDAFAALDYETAKTVMALHGKQLLGFEEFVRAAYGVTERTSADGDPKATKLDAARTSKWGLMQATGNLWVWGHDGDPDMPRASIFGGSWISGRSAGPRYAYLGDWPGVSDGTVGARGRCDHLQLG